MINFHPSSNQLQHFVLGNSEPTLALMISAHVDMCPQCQSMCLKLQEIQTIESLSEEIEGVPNLEAMLAQIVRLPQAAKSNKPKVKETDIELDGRCFMLPRTLQRYAQHTGSWSRLVGKLWQAPVDLGGLGKAHFIYMEKGGKVPEHTHRGTEMTLVIDGQYSDGLAHYDCGDFTLLDSQAKHLPYSEVDEGCLVFTIVDKPLYFTAGIARLLNPFSHLFF